MISNNNSREKTSERKNTNNLSLELAPHPDDIAGNRHSGDGGMCAGWNRHKDGSMPKLFRQPGQPEVGNGLPVRTIASSVRRSNPGFTNGRPRQYTGNWKPAHVIQMISCPPHPAAWIAGTGSCPPSTIRVRGKIRTGGCVRNLPQALCATSGIYTSRIVAGAAWLIIETRTICRDSCHRLF